MKRIKFRKDTDTPFNTRDIFVELLTVNPPGQGGNIEDMIKKVDLKKRIAKVDISSEDAGFDFKDNEYDMIKALYKVNGFPINSEFFVQVWTDINEYTSVTPPSKSMEGPNADKKA